jgi:predicted transcriptional regulator
MRTLVEIGAAQIQELDELSRRQNQSRATLIREAIGDYLEKHRCSPLDAAFGAWANREVDGLVYQEQVRNKW